MSSTARVKKRITPTSVVPVPVPEPRRIYDPKSQNNTQLPAASVFFFEAKKKLSPASVFDLEIEKQLHNNSENINVHDNKKIGNIIQNIYGHHLTAKTKHIRTQNALKRKATQNARNKKSKSKGGKTRRRRNNNK